MSGIWTYSRTTPFCSDAHFGESHACKGTSNPIVKPGVVPPTERTQISYLYISSCDCRQCRKMDVAFNFSALYGWKHHAASVIVNNFSSNSFHLYYDFCTVYELPTRFYTQFCVRSRFLLVELVPACIQCRSFSTFILTSCMLSRTEWM